MVPPRPAAPPIALLDLAAQHAPLQEALVAAAARVLGSHTFILGPDVEAFEGELAAAIGATHAIGVSSGTDALVASLLALGVGPGDEVITTPFSFIATAAAIARVGAKAVFVDIEPTTYAIDPAGVLAAINERTRAVLPVHLFGQMADLRRLLAITEPRGVPLIEDAAQAIAASRDGLGSGTSGTLGTLSFFPSKNLGGAGDGGMVLTQDQALADKLRLLRNHGQAQKNVASELGGNFRLDTLQAALLRVKLPHLERWTAARRTVAARYRLLFGQMGLDVAAGALTQDTPFTLPQEAPNTHHVYNQFVLRSPRRDSLHAYLARVGIASAIYYPRPLHLQPAFAGWGYVEGAFPHSERAARECLALPIHPELTEQEQARIASAVMAHDTAPAQSLLPRPSPRLNLRKSSLFSALSALSQLEAAGDRTPRGAAPRFCVCPAHGERRPPRRLLAERVLPCRRGPAAACERALRRLVVAPASRSLPR